MVLIVPLLIAALTYFTLHQVEAVFRWKAQRELREMLLLECPAPTGDGSDDDALIGIVDYVQSQYSLGIGNFNMAWPNGVSVCVKGRYNLPSPPKSWQWSKEQCPPSSCSALESPSSTTAPSSGDASSSGALSG